MTSIELERSLRRPVKPATAASVQQTRAESLRRALNVTVALIGLILAAPIMAVIALLIKCTSRGPVFFTQTRVGVDRRRRSVATGIRRQFDAGGRRFTIYKFRTMQVGNGEAEMWATPDDPRVTPLGRILRKYRLDELPQLINVLRGEMNVVGPRPEQPRLFTDLRQHIDGYQIRQTVLPGITGWAQVNQQYDASVDDVRRKLELDLEYIERRSPGEDLRILLRTVPVVMLKKGAW